MIQFTATIAFAFLLVTSFAGGLEKQWTKTKVEGETVPSVTFKTRVRTNEVTENPFDWKDLTSEDYFKGKRAVVFALPGAFTPTCKSV
jgi:Redoxin